MTNFQRDGADSNTQVGNDFERAAVAALAAQGLVVERGYAVEVGAAALKKARRFDFGSADPAILVECKCHTWTKGNNSPSAKLTAWNEAMYYFCLAPGRFRKILFVLKDFCPRRQETLAEHYVRRFPHLIPAGVEIWEYDEAERSHRVL